MFTRVKLECCRLAGCQGSSRIVLFETLKVIWDNEQFATLGHSLINALSKLMDQCLYGCLRVLVDVELLDKGLTLIKDTELNVNI